MLVVIENDLIRVEINPFGAELWSIIDKKTKVEYLWQGEEPWHRRAPILFPIVGRLKSDQYTWEGKSYSLTQHGFARESLFDIESETEDTITFSLTSFPETKLLYPFDFRFRIIFTLKNCALYQTFEVVNQSRTEMPVSFGAHPAFNVHPLSEYVLEVEKQSGNRMSDTVVNGIRNGVLRDVFDGDRIELTPTLFDQDALIYSDLTYFTTHILKRDSSPYISVHYPNFTYLGIWAKPGAPFVCIEPWMGVADKKEEKGDIRNKEGILILQPKEMVERRMEMRFF